MSGSDRLVGRRVRNELPDLSVWAVLLDELGWMGDGACRVSGVSTALFFPENGRKSQAQTARAKRLCAGCAVRETCAAYAMDRPTLSGIWGGTTESERRIRRRRLKLSMSNDSV